jgi:hypothetical protein
MGLKTLLPKKSKRGYKRLFFNIKCILYHANILKISLGYKDFHITDYITKCQLWNW